MKKVFPFLVVFCILLGNFQVKATELVIDVPTEDIMEFGDLGLSILDILATGGKISVEDIEDLNDLRLALEGTGYRPHGLSANNRARLKTAKQNQLLQGYSHITGPILLDWGVHEYNVATNYSSSWIRSYTETGEDEVDPSQNIPELYSFMSNTNNLYFSGVDIINGSSNYYYTSDGGGVSTWKVDPSQITFISSNFTSYQNHLSNAGVNSPFLELFARSPLMTISIYSNQDESVSVIYSQANPVSFLSGRWDNDGSPNYSARFTGYNSSTDTINYYPNYGGNSNIPLYNQASFASLSLACNYIYQHYANINLFVDNVPWCITGQISQTPTVDFTDVIGTGADDDPIYDVWMPDTLTGEAGFDLTSLLDAIADFINDDTNDRVLAWDDISDQIIDIDGTLERVGVRKRAVAEVQEDDEVIEDTGDFPDIPLPDMPISDAFSGTSVLAELIDACQNTLPVELIACFWGIVFCCFIIGLIKILHK